MNCVRVLFFFEIKKNSIKSTKIQF